MVWLKLPPVAVQGEVSVANVGLLFIFADVELHGRRARTLTAGLPVKVVAEHTGHTVALMLSTYAHVVLGSR